MTFDDWCRQNNLKNTEVGRRLGASRVAVHYWRTGIHRPNPNYTELIGELTAGAVTAIDLQRAYQAAR